MWFATRPASAVGMRFGSSLACTRMFSRLANLSARPECRGQLKSVIGQKNSQMGLRFASNSAKAPGSSEMSWSDFFKLRKRRRVVGYVASIFTATAASALAFEYFANLVIDFNKTFMGIEMQWIYLGGIAISGFLGWIVGPFVGNQVFNLSIGSSRAAFNHMDNVFLRHVARNRPNPVRHNVNTNPLPDYYGEKIGSLHDYRRWLREGRLFEKKATKFL